MERQKRFFVFFLFLLAVGICSGAFFEVFMNGSIKDRLSDALGNFLLTDAEGAVSFAACFGYACRNGLPVWFLCLIGPLFLPFLLFLPLLLLLKGFSLGFTAAMTLEALGLDGVTDLALTLLPQNLIQIPLFCLLAAVSADRGIVLLKESSGRRRAGARRCRSGSPENTRRYLIFYFFGLLILIFSCLLEAFLLS